jgi:glutamate synthase (NADH)
LRFLGAKSIVNFELLPQPPGDRAHENPWPEFPRVFKVDYGHAEVKAIHGKDPRQYCVLSKSFVSDGKGNVAGINTVRVEWTRDANGRWKMVEIPGSEELFEADLVLLALGFLGPEHALLKQLDVEIDAKSNIIKTGGTSKYRTNIDGVFAAGDCRRGQSLIVWGINEGRQAAREIDNFLMGTSKSLLPVSGGITKLELELSETLVQIR